MPRPAKPVNTKRPPSRERGIVTPGAVDLHFHGAFGVDLMRATPDEMDALSEQMWKQGVAGFCPTTLSAAPSELYAAVDRMGQWIERESAPGAKPLGIHLEGPYLNPQAAGAHPGEILRALDFDELETLWERSRGHLKILTLAPELLSLSELKRLGTWARKKKIRLSLGHSRASLDEAHAAFDAGFSGITHAWNALAYHHRDPGAMGAAFGDPNIIVELIIDGIHVAPELTNWTMQLHPEGVAFVSDAAPAAGTDGKHLCSFGPIQCRFQGGAARTPDGHLAGGGVLLARAYADWIAGQAELTGEKPETILRETVGSFHEIPLKSLFLKGNVLGGRDLRWTRGRNGKLDFVPLPNPKRR